MESQSAQQLIRKKCDACEGGVEPFSQPDAKAQLDRLGGWQLTHEGQRIRKQWVAKNFTAAMKFFNRVADLAEEEGHHPDLHVEGYRHVAIEIWTHAIGGLSENDFILAAKIDRIPIELQS